MTSSTLPIRERRARGFTLVETLTAVVILVFGLTTLLTVAARCMASIRMSKQFQDAQWSLGQGEALWPLIATEDPMDHEVGPETLDNGHVFERRIEETEDEGLYIVRTKVTWSSQGRQSSEEVVRYLVQENANE